MIKIKNKNKFTTFLCACLLAVGSLFGLVGSVGNTLAYTPSLIDNSTMQNYIVNYKDYDYNNIFDGYFEFQGYNTLVANSVSIKFYDFNNNILQVSTGNVTVDNNNFRIYGLSSSNSIFTVTPNASSYNINAYIGYIVYSSTSSIVDVLSKNIVCISALFNNGNIYNVISKSQFDLYYAYNQGLSDGDNYDTAYSDGQNSVINNPNDYNLYTQAQYQQNYVNGQNSVINNPSSFGLYTQAQYQQNYTDGYYAGIIQGQNNVVENPNNFGLNTNQQLQDSYNNGYIDGEQSTNAYQNGLADGILQGQNSVINNPNNYDLYTLQQYNDNYDKGYRDGISYALYGIFSDIDYTVTQSQGNTILENALLPYLNGFTLNPDYFGNPGSVTSSNVIFDITFNKPFEFNNQLRFTFTSNPNYYLEFTLVDTNNNNYRYYYEKQTEYIRDTDNNIIDTVVTETIAPLLDINGNYVTGPVPSGVLINGLNFYIRNNYYDKVEVFLHQNSADYENGYSVGYENGYNNGVGSVDTSNIYDTAYNSGFNVGKEVGRSEGIASANDYSFISMFGALFDAPVKTLTGLLNFDLFGFNLLNFFTSLLTLSLVIWLISKFI